VRFLFLLGALPAWPHSRNSFVSERRVDRNYYFGDCGNVILLLDIFAIVSVLIGSCNALR
jgi:hypothetical protein